MKKILAVAVSVAAFPALAGSWGAADSVRDSLRTIYSDLGCSAGTSCFGDTVTENNKYGGTGEDKGAGDQEYAELLYRIDNLDDTLGHITLIKDADGNLVASGGGADGGFSLSEVIEQVGEFVTGVETDLFRKYNTNQADDWEISNSVDSDGIHSGIKWGHGLATRKLERIVYAVNAVNDVIANATDKADKEAAVDFFYNGTAYTGTYSMTLNSKANGWAGFNSNGSTVGEGVAFNNAVDALKSISDSSGSSLGSFDAATDFGSDWQLGGGADTAYSATGYKATTRDIEHESDNTNYMYTSYTNYVAKRKSFRVSSRTFDDLGTASAPSSSVWTYTEQEIPGKNSSYHGTTHQGRVTLTNGTIKRINRCTAGVSQCSAHGMFFGYVIEGEAAQYTSFQAVINRLRELDPNAI